MRSGLVLVLCAISMLAGCGGGDGGGNPPPVSNNPAPPPPTPSPPTIGTSGGTVTEVSGATVIVPAGALSADTTIRIAIDSTGAPDLPTGLTGQGNTYVITPHGGNFTQPVQVRIPAPAVTLQPNQEIKLAKAQPGEPWVVLTGTRLSDGVLSAEVDSFSYFRSVIVTYPRVLVEVPPLQVTAVNLNCGTQPCDRVFERVNATYEVTANNGQLPQGCTENPQLFISGREASGGSVFISFPIQFSGGRLIQAFDRVPSNRYELKVNLICGLYLADMGASFHRAISWAEPPQYPYTAVMRMPAQLDVVPGLTANLEAILGGGAAMRAFSVFTGATASDRAVIDWQRSDDNGTSWRTLASSYQHEANPLPFGTGVEWRFWSVSHSFVGNTTDQGALIRVYACYTTSRPGFTSMPCIYGPPTRLNVLQQSAFPAIVSGPRSILIRTGQTADLSVTASGLPAPTLQWQTRPANSNGAWSNVSTGNGATAAQYITAPLGLADNGTQYRVVATNALGVAESAAVTVSVSDLNMAPTITTQPGNLSVAAGSDAVFAVSARGTEALSYQWFRNGTALSGANSPVLRLTGVTMLNAGNFSVTVSNSAGDADSNVATLTVVPGTPVAVAPTLVTQPSSVVVNAGNTATFAVGIDGTGPFTFQWRRNGTAIPGATSAVLTFNNVQTGNAGSYSVLVSNAANATGVASNPAELSVLTGGAASAPTITTQPAMLIVPPGGSGILAVAATGSGPISYQWLNDGVPIPGATDAVLRFDNVELSSEGLFAVRVSNSLGEVLSDEVRLYLLGSPYILEHPDAVSAYENAVATFDVAVQGTGVRYQWLLNGLQIGGADQASYSTPSLTLADSGAVYSVIVYNSAGLEFSQGAVLTVQALAPPTVAQQPADATIEAGATASLCMAFGGTPPFGVQMSRWSGSAWTPIGARVTVNDNASTCRDTPALQSAETGAQFRFSANNADASAPEAVTRTVTVTVNAPPAINTATLASVTSIGTVPDNVSGQPSISADGNLVAFTSVGTNLVPGGTGNPSESGHAYLRNLTTGTTTLINQTPGGGQSSRGVVELELAAGGRYVVFTSLAGDLVADDTNGSMDVFLRDLQNGTTERLNLYPDGSQITDAGNGVGDGRLNISADGRWVTFASYYDLDGSSSTPPGAYDLYLRDTQNDVTRLVASHPNYGVGAVTMSGDGAYIAYVTGLISPATGIINLYEVQTSTVSTVFTVDATIWPEGLANQLSLSGNGRYLAFGVRSAALLGGSTFGQVVVLDRLAPSPLILVSTGTAGIGNSNSYYPRMSYDGRYVLFDSTAPNLTGASHTLDTYALVRDLQAQTTSVASRRPDGVRAPVPQGGGHALSADGSIVAFTADHNVMFGVMAGAQVYAAPRP